MKHVVILVKLVDAEIDEDGYAHNTREEVIATMNFGGSFGTDAKEIEKRIGGALLYDIGYRYGKSIGKCRDLIIGIDSDGKFFYKL